METFLWVVIALLGLSAIGKLVWLAKGRFPLRDPVSEAMDVVINGALIVWGVVLLIGLK
jgi:hypothetical protein